MPLPAEPLATEPLPAVVVTGASSGIGRELALQAAREGGPLLLLGRSGTALAALAEAIEARGGQAAWLALDLCEPDALERIETALAGRGWCCDVLVHAAGIGVVTPAHAGQAARQLQALDLNARVLTALVLRLLPPMVERGRGGVLAVGSIAGYVPGPNMAVYYASKAYVRSLAAALHAETRGSGVTVTCLAPGFVDTPFLQQAGLRSTRLRKILPRTSAAAVARAGWRGFRRGRRLVVPGLANQLLVASSRLLPSTWMARLIGSLQR